MAPYIYNNRKSVAIRALQTVIRQTCYPFYHVFFFSKVFMDLLGFPSF